MDFKLLNRTKVFKDPIHGFININYEIILKVINTKELQRLKRIRQLGGTYQVFPTAEHTRFSHSLGCYETCREMIENIEGLKESLNEREVVSVLCAALLHDVGHGPFSHAFSMIHSIDHEEYSSSIIRSDSEVSEVLKEYDLNEEVAQIIDKTHENKLLVQLVSSQIDADRTDYLRRDAYFTGTVFGYIDFDRLVRMMKVVDDKIVFKEAGLPTVESYMLGRYHMYKSVYYHAASLCVEVIAINMIKRYFDLKRENYKFKHEYKYLDPFMSNTLVSNEDYYQLDDFVIYFYAKQFMDEDDVIVKDLANRFINRKLFNRTYAKEMFLEDYKDEVKDKGLDPRYYFYYALPRNNVYKKYGKDNYASIYVLTRDNQIEELSNISRVVDALSNDVVTSEDDYVVLYG